MDYFSVRLDENEIKKISNLGLAHIGDGVFELLVRTWLCVHGGVRADEMHRATVARVSAPAQAAAAERILPLLTERELAVFHRGRNTKVNSVPKRASHREYHEATALEALFGYLYLTGEHDRINELFARMMEETDHAS